MSGIVVERGLEEAGQCGGKMSRPRGGQIFEVKRIFRMCSLKSESAASAALSKSIQNQGSIDNHFVT